MRIGLRTVSSFLFIGALVKTISTGEPSGTFLKIPYDFRIPTRARLKCRLWNSRDDRIFTPNIFGVGWSINFYQVADRLGLLEEVRKEVDGSEDTQD